VTLNKCTDLSALYAPIYSLQFALSPIGRSASVETNIIRKKIMNHVFSNHKMARLGRCAVTFVFLILFSTIHGDKCEGSDSFSEGENCRGTETNLITTYDMKTIQNETCLCVCCSPVSISTYCHRGGLNYFLTISYFFYYYYGAEQSQDA